MADPDWKLLETFVRVAETGSLTAAAELLGTSQPTASRNVKELEEAIGTRLFVRHSRGLSLSDRGADLFASAKALDEGVKSLFRRASGLGEDPKGTVRVSVNEPIGVHVLPDCFATLRQEFPDVAIELVIDNRVANLSRREADIAVRMFRPEQLDLVARRIGDIELGFFASRGYVTRRGLPNSAGDLSGHTLIGSDRDPSFPRAVAALGLQPEQFTFKTDSILAQIEAIVRGVGIGGTHLGIAARYPDLVPVLPSIRVDPLDVWIVMHQDLRGDPAVRKVFDAMSAALESYCGDPSGKGALPKGGRAGRSRRTRPRLRGSGAPT
jgi:DNA-binding transcriptional LysR family regulator